MCFLHCQAGLLLYIDDDNWLKTGIEYCDGLPRLSTVVTRCGYSDWSTQPWRSSKQQTPPSSSLSTTTLLRQQTGSSTRDGARGDDNKDDDGNDNDSGTRWVGARLRTHKVHCSLNSSVVVEAACGSSQVKDDSMDTAMPAASAVQDNPYQMTRIAQLSASMDASSTVAPSLVATDGSVTADGRPTCWWVGPYAACPVGQKGCLATFWDFAVSPRVPAVHSNDPLEAAAVADPINP